MKILRYCTLLALCSCEKIKVAYFPGYSDEYSVSQLKMDNITHIMYAFAIPGPKGQGIYINGNYFPPEQEDKLKQLVKKAHESNVSVLVSIGGYTGSRYISNIIKDNILKARFIRSISKLVHNFNLDGIDIDWEYPGREGRKCNLFDSVNDVNNYSLFLIELRRKLEKDTKAIEKDRKILSNKLITAAFYVNPFKENSKINLNKSLVNNFDFIMVMAYDINGKWSRIPGANAPTEGLLSFKSSIKDWIATGIPKRKIIMGLAFYGRSMYIKSIKATKTIDSFNLKNFVVDKSDIKGDSDDIKEAPEIEDCSSKDEVYVPKNDTIIEDDYLPGYQYSGIWKYKNIVSEILNGKSGWNKEFDEESKTPYLTKVVNDKVAFISYDDANSIKNKTKLIQINELGGFMIWNLEQDTDDMELRKAALKGLLEIPENN